MGNGERKKCHSSPVKQMIPLLTHNKMFPGQGSSIRGKDQLDIHVVIQNSGMVQRQRSWPSASHTSIWTKARGLEVSLGTHRSHFSMERAWGWVQGQEVNSDTHTVTLLVWAVVPKGSSCSLRFHTARNVSSGTWKWKSSESWQRS